MKRYLFLLTILLTTLLSTFTGCGSKGSVAIIGGADGPTAVFVTGSKWALALELVVILIVIILVIIGIVYLIKHRKKK